MRFYPRLIPTVITLCLLYPAIPSRADDTQAAATALQRDKAAKATDVIAVGGDEGKLVLAFYDRAGAYYALGELEKAASDIDETLNHIKKLPNPDNQNSAWVAALSLKGDIAVNRRKWHDAIDAYEQVQKHGDFAGLLGSPAVYYYNLSRAYAHEDYPYNSRLNATHAIEILKDKTGEEDGHMRMLALRQRAIAFYGEGDLETAKADWAAAKAIEPKLGDAPFDPDQAPLNKAVANGREKERIARARFLMGKAEDAAHDLDFYSAMGAGDDDLDAEDGGTLSLADATAANATPVSLVDDALNDLDMAIHRDIGDTWGLQSFEIALERGRARAFRYQLDPDDGRYSLHDVDEELNRAVKLRPLDLDARRARADWLVYRLEHLNEEAQKKGMNLDDREKTRAALLYVANDDLARVLLANPLNTGLHIARAKLTIEQPSASIAGKPLLAVTGSPDDSRMPYADPNAALFDLEAALNAGGKPALSDTDKAWAAKAYAALNEKSKNKPAGAALEWKEKGNAANAKNEFDKALESYNTALRIDPKYADALNNRSGSYRHRAQWDLALHDLDEVIKIAPQHKAAYINRSGVRVQVGDFDGAVTDARRAVEVAPDDAVRQAANKALVFALFARADDLSEKKDKWAKSFDDYHEGNTLISKVKLETDAIRLQYEGTMAANLGRGAEALTALRAAHISKPDDVWIAGWLTVVATALNEADAPALEADVTRRGDRQTLSSLNDVALGFAQNGPRLTKDPDAEAARMTALRDRLYKGYSDKPGGRVISGGEN